MAARPKGVLWLLACLLACLSCDGGYNKLNRAMQRGHLLMASCTDTIPLQWVNGMPAAQVRMADNAAQWWLIDTGLPTLLLPEALPNAAAEPCLPLLNDEGDTLAQSLAHISALGIGHASLVQVAALVASPQAAQWLRRHGVAGVLGANAMQHAVWHFDVTNHRAIVAAPTCAQPVDEWRKNALEIPFLRTLHRSPKFLVSVNNFPRKAVAVLTTGFAGSLKLPESYLDDFPSFLFRHSLAVVQPRADTTQALAITLHHMRDTLFANPVALLGLPGAELCNLPHAVLRRDATCRLGIRAWSPYPFTIHWQRQKIYWRQTAR